MQYHSIASLFFGLTQLTEYQYLRIILSKSRKKVESKMAGVKTVGITWGGSSAQTLRAENPDRIANSFVELEIIITSLLDA